MNKILLTLLLSVSNFINILYNCLQCTYPAEVALSLDKVTKTSEKASFVYS